MNPKLHSILLELDHKFDIELKDYFLLGDNDKAELTKIILENFQKEVDRNPLFLYLLRDAFKTKLKEAEIEQEFEKCDIYNRLIQTLDGFTLFLFGDKNQVK